MKTKRQLVVDLTNVLYWNGRLGEDDQRDMSLFSWIYFDWMKREPNRKAFFGLLSIANLTLVLLHKDFPKDYNGQQNESVAIVMAGLKRTIERQKKTGSYALDGELMKHFPVVLSLHDKQITEVPRKVLDACITFVNKK